MHRLARPTLALFVLALGASCPEPDGKDRPPSDADADTDADSDADADADTDADADPTEHAFEPAVVLLSAWFGYDADAGGLVDVVSPYGTVESRIRLEVGDAGWEATGYDGYRTDLYCVVELPLTDSTPAAWAQAEPSVWYGVEYAGAPLDTDCGDYDIDPALYAGYPDYGTALARSRPWGVGVGELSPDNPYLDDFVATYPYAVIPPGAIFGGYAEDGILGAVQDQAMAVAFAVDADGIVDYTSYLPATDVHPGGVGLATGFYRIYFLYHVTL